MPIIDQIIMKPWQMNLWRIATEPSIGRMDINYTLPRQCGKTTIAAILSRLSNVVVYVSTLRAKEIMVGYGGNGEAIYTVRQSMGSVTEVRQREVTVLDDCYSLPALNINNHIQIYLSTPPSMEEARPEPTIDHEDVEARIRDPDEERFNRIPTERIEE